MKLSTKGQYALLAMVDLALHQDVGPIALSQIAERQQLPLRYLEQLFPKLRREGLVVSVRGARGGYSLARPRQEIAVSEIMVAVEEPIRLMRCKSGSGISCQGKPTQCLTHALLSKLNRVIVGYLSGVTLDQVCNRELPDLLGKST